MGGSGCGKSTLLKHLVGLLPPAAGTVTTTASTTGQPTSDAQRAARRLRHAVPERGAVVVDERARERLPAARSRPGASSTRAQREARAREVLGLGGPGRVRRLLSRPTCRGGMKKRAGLARAIVAEPPLLFLDEPSAGLDPISSQRLDDLILDDPRAHRRGRGVGQPRAAEPVRDRRRRHLPRRRQQAADRARQPARAARRCGTHPTGARLPAPRRAAAALERSRGQRTDAAP